MPGTLFLVPNLLGVVPPTDVLPARTIAVARRLSHWVVETPKAARAFIKSLDPPAPIATLDIRELGPSPDPVHLAALLSPAQAGADVGVLSDAGCPGVADPGAALVAAAHDAGVRVVPLVGPSAILLALMASGMNGQSFAFHGYLPIHPEERAAALQRLENESRAQVRAQIFIETPYRNVAMLGAIATVLGPDTTVCVAADLTLPSETIVRSSARSWQRRDHSPFAKRPALFVLQA
ncbi:MAG TPA: SAM-dependent methyltransferase [Casimicrobiaceae bacterium]|nr:SAM-dependent methyltransferase [Casimicrobiaceae bacterium]